jgi:hypothetical protein
MSVKPLMVSLLVFEAGGCLMAVSASEVTQLGGSDPLFTKIESRAAFDLDEYFSGRESNGPWLQWRRGTRSAWLRVKCVVDVVPIALSMLTPMPALLRRQLPTRVFVAAGARGDDVFLLLDPARLTP